MEGTQVSRRSGSGRAAVEGLKQLFGIPGRPVATSGIPGLGPKFGGFHGHTFFGKNAGQPDDAFKNSGRPHTTSTDREKPTTAPSTAAGSPHTGESDKPSSSTSMEPTSPLSRSTETVNGTTTASPTAAAGPSAPFMSITTSGCQRDDHSVMDSTRTKIPNGEDGGEPPCPSRAATSSAFTRGPDPSTPPVLGSASRLTAGAIAGLVSFIVAFAVVCGLYLRMLRRRKKARAAARFDIVDPCALPPSLRASRSSLAASESVPHFITAQDADAMHAREAEPDPFADPRDEAKHFAHPSDAASVVHSEITSYTMSG